jgi:hypothetical protein
MVRGLSRILAAVALIAAAACGSDTTEPIDPADGELNDFSAGVEGDQAGLPGLMLSSHGVPGTTGCTFDAESGRIECPPITRNGLTITRSLQFLDADGVPQPQRGLNVVTVNTQLLVEGTVALADGGELTVNRSSDLTVSGFGPSSAQLTHNGVEQGTITGTRNHTTLGTITSSENFSHTSVDVVIPKRTDETRHMRFPLSGTTTRSVEFARTIQSTGATHTFSYSELITFNGTAVVSAIVTKNGETRTCTRNLLTRVLHCGE